MFKGTVHLEIRNAGSPSGVLCTLSIQTVQVCVYEWWRYRPQRCLPSLQHNGTERHTKTLKMYVKEKVNSSVSIHQTWSKMIHRPCWAASRMNSRPTTGIGRHQASLVIGVWFFCQSIKYKLNLWLWCGFLSHNVQPTTLSDKSTSSFSI